MQWTKLHKLQDDISWRWLWFSYLILLCVTAWLLHFRSDQCQVCRVTRHNNYTTHIARVIRADRRRMVELREETGVQRSLTERLVRGRLQWAGHVEKMADDRLPKRAAELWEQDRRRRGRPRLRWENCVKRDARKAGEEEDWKKKTRDRGGWKRLPDEVVKKLRGAPHPWQREKKGREKHGYSIMHTCYTHWLGLNWNNVKLHTYTVSATPVIGGTRGWWGGTIS